MSRLLFMLEGSDAGKFIPFADLNEAQRLIDEGIAQCARAPAHTIRRPNYQTCEMRADTDTPVEVMVAPPPPPPPPPAQEIEEELPVAETVDEA